MRSNDVERCLRRRFSGGRSTAARVLDYVMLRLVLLIGAYLFFSAQAFRARVSLALALLLLGLVSLVLRVWREIAYTRFVYAERKRISYDLLLESLLLTPAPRLHQIAISLQESGETTALLVCASPANENELLNVLRRKGSNRVFAVSPAGWTKQAEAFAARLGFVRLCPVETFLREAQKSGVRITPQMVDARIRADEEDRRRRRARSFAFAFPKSAATKYLFAALLLTICSFLTRYALYYRLLAGLCMSVCFVCTALAVRKPKEA